MTDARVEFVGEPPPIKSRRKGVWLERLAPFVERPGEWGRIVVDNVQPINVAQMLRDRKIVMPPGYWEVAQRTMPDGELQVFVRYTPENGANA